MSSLELFCPSTGGHEEARQTWLDTMSKPWAIMIDSTSEGDDAGFLNKCQNFYKFSEADIQAYLHSDLFIHEHGWDQRVLAEFDDPQVGVVGFVGAKRLGYEHIYKVLYDHTQLARADVFSNLTDAEVHGRRETGSQPAAVLDSCALMVRRSLLDRCGGWPVRSYPNNPHCTDLWLCLMARRHGQSVRMVGVGCTHRSGGKGEIGSKWLEQHGTDIVHHRRAHEITYDQFRDVLPVVVK